jgi:hypothetical protein
MKINHFIKRLKNSIILPFSREELSKPPHHPNTIRIKSQGITLFDVNHIIGIKDFEDTAVKKYPAASLRVNNVIALLLCPGK